MMKLDVEAKKIRAEKAQLLADKCKNERDIYYLDVSSLQLEGYETPTAIPWGSPDDPLMGICIEHPYEVDGEVFTSNEYFECSCDF